MASENSAPDPQRPPLEEDPAPVVTSFTVPMVARPIDEAMFTDLGYPEVIFTSEPGGGIRVTVPGDLDLDGIDVAKMKCRLVTADADAETVLWNRYTWVQPNRDYLDIEAPTAEQVAAQVAALTLQANNLAASTALGVPPVPVAPPDWAAQVAYAIGDQVTYEGAVYECTQAHQSQVGWEPPNVPALWSKVA